MKDKTVAIQPNRLDWIDANKGLAIIAVVIYHVTMGLEKAGTLLLTQELQYFWLSVTALATPIFFLMSGYFIEKSLVKAGPKKFFTISLHYILYPYFLWAIVQLGIKIWFSGFVNSTVDSINFLSLLIDPPAQFWFLHALFLAQLLFGLYFCLLNRFHLIVAFSILLLSWMIGEFSTIADALRAFGFLVLGAWWGRQKNPEALTTVWIMLLSVAIYILSLILYKEFMQPHGLEGVTNFVGGIAVTIITSALFLKFGSPKLLTMLGKYSMYIFVFHIMCLVPVRVLFHMADIHLSLPLIVFSTLAGLVCPIMAAIVIERLGIAAYLGIKPVNFSLQKFFSVFQIKAQA